MDLLVGIPVERPQQDDPAVPSPPGLSSPSHLYQSPLPPVDEEVSNMMLRVTGWIRNPMKRIRVHPPVFLFLLPHQRFDQYSCNPCMRLGWQFLLFHLVCYVSRANHHVMDRSSTLPVVSALRAVLNTTENWTSAITLTRRNMLRPSPHRWLLSNSLMCEVGSRMHLTELPLRSDCDVETLLYLTSEYHVNHHPHPPFDQRHVPPMCKGMRMLCVNPPSMYPSQPVPQSNPHGSGSPLAHRKYRPLCPLMSNPLPKIPSLAVTPPMKIICGCCNMHESRADLVTRTALTS